MRRKERGGAGLRFVWELATSRKDRRRKKTNSFVWKKDAILLPVITSGNTPAYTVQTDNAGVFF